MCRRPRTSSGGTIPFFDSAPKSAGEEAGGDARASPRESIHPSDPPLPLVVAGTLDPRPGAPAPGPPPTLAPPVRNRLPETASAGASTSDEPARGEVIDGGRPRPSLRFHAECDAGTRAVPALEDSCAAAPEANDEAADADADAEGGAGEGLAPDAGTPARPSCEARRAAAAPVGPGTGSAVPAAVAATDVPGGDARVGSTRASEGLGVPSADRRDSRKSSASACVTVAWGVCALAPAPTPALTPAPAPTVDAEFVACAPVPARKAPASSAPTRRALLSASPLPDSASSSTVLPAGGDSSSLAPLPSSRAPSSPSPRPIPRPRPRVSTAERMMGTPSAVAEVSNTGHTCVTCPAGTGG